MTESQRKILDMLQEAKSKLNEIESIGCKIEQKQSSKSNINVDIKKEDYETNNASIVRYRINTESEAATKKQGIINIVINLLVYIGCTVVAVIMFSSAFEAVISVLGSEEYVGLSLTLVCIGLIAGAILVLLNALESGGKYPPKVFKVLSIIGCGVGGVLLISLLGNSTTDGYTSDIGGFFGAIGILGAGIAFSIIKGIIDRGIGDRNHKKSLRAHSHELEDAKQKDNQEEERYKKDVEDAIAEKKKEIDSEIRELEKQRELLWADFDSYRLLPRKDLEKDPHAVGHMIGIIYDNKADTVEAAVSVYKKERKEQKERERLEKEEKAKREAKRKAEQARIEAERKAEQARIEAEIKRNSPGRVVVYATEDDKGKNADVFIDGGYYGAINYALGFCSYQLAPGPHTINVIIHSRGYSFQSAPQSFYLEGGTELTLHFKLLGYNNIYCLKY